MKVMELQQFLRDVAKFAEATGASKLATLSQTVECLEPFKTQDLTNFNQFLRIADEYVRTGDLPEFVTKKKSATQKQPKAPKVAKPPKLTVPEATQIFLQLIERATDSRLDFATIDSEINKLHDLSDKDLKALAREVNRTLPSKCRKKDEKVEAFKLMIKDAKESFERNQRPVETGTTAPIA